MSWNEYVKNLQCRSKFADKGCIIGLDGSIWTTPDENVIDITPAEAVSIAHTMNCQDYSQFQTNGITIGGLKYQFLRYNEKAVYGKKTGSGGISLQSTNRAIVVSHCVEGGQQGKVNDAVFKVAEYLEQNGY